MTIQLSWDANPDAELVSEYKVYQSFNGGPFELLATVAAPDTFLDIVDPPTGQYNWRVSAVNLAGEGSQSATIEGPQLPSIPQNVQADVV
jgi:hypothetical protein